MLLLNSYLYHENFPRLISVFKNITFCDSTDILKHEWDGLLNTRPLSDIQDAFPAVLPGTPGTVSGHCIHGVPSRQLALNLTQGTEEEEFSKFTHSQARDSSGGGREGGLVRKREESQNSSSQMPREGEGQGRRRRPVSEGREAPALFANCAQPSLH